MQEWTAIRQRELSATKTLQVLALTLIVLLGFVLRLRGLSSAGFNEDEVSKVEAARAYLHGNFSHEREHPMAMKALIAVSLAAADCWNHGFGHSHQVSEEAVVRMPNIIVGSLTAVVIYLLAQEYFGAEVGLLSALFWSTGTIAIMDNRVAKEDTMLVFFTWLAYYFYIRAKNITTTNTQQAEGYYGASGASFGLMLASKYFLHYLGLIFLFYTLLGKKQKFPPRRRRDTLVLFGAFILVFILADPVILLPGTWKYFLNYVGEGTMTHHGYLVMGHLCFDDPAHLWGGMPIYLYPLLLILKTPIPVLVALTVGMVETWRHRDEPGSFFLIFMFLFWLVPFSLSSAKWLRYMLSWMPTIYILAALGVTKVFAWASELGSPRAYRQWALSAAVALIFLVVPAWVCARNAPYYTLYLNPLGFGRTAFYFPHDEMNDMGLREAIDHIARKAPPGAYVGGQTESVFDYYFHKFRRDDLHYFDLSGSVSVADASHPTYLVVQDGRKYFENIAFIQAVESSQLPVKTVEIGGAPAARIYTASEVAELRAHD